MSITAGDVLKNPIDSGYKYILAYGIAIVLFVVVIKSKVGYAAMYYALVLALLFLLVTESRFIADSLAPITGQIAVDLGGQASKALTVISPP